MKKSFFIALCILSAIQTQYTQTLRQKIGQMIMVGFSGTSVPETLKTDLSVRNLGGVMYFAANIQNPQQIRNLSDSISLIASTPPFIATDQEGGRVARLSRKNGFDTSYTAYKLGYVFGSVDSTLLMAERMSGWLKNSSINVNFAPVSDVNVNPQSPAIGKLERSYSKIPPTVAEHNTAFINGMHRNNIITTIKHFPGHGSAATDSHLGFTDISTTWADSELTPYRMLIARGYSDFVMAGHLFNSQIDSSFPATLSHKAITGVLRGQLGFTGLVITDELFMQAIASNYSMEQSVEHAVNAGVDVLLYATNIKNNIAVVEQVISIIERKVQQGKISVDRIQQSYDRIMALKQRYGIITATQEFAGDMRVTDIALQQNYPNPFNPATKIEFVLKKTARVSIRVYDILGREVALLVNREFASGTHSVQFDSRLNNHLSGGVYFYQLRSGNVLITKKMMLIQ